MMRRVQPQPDFVVAGGDWFGHVAPQHTSGATVLEAAVHIAEELAASFGDAPVIHAIGNHDTWPYYSLAPAWRQFSTAWEQSPALGTSYMRQTFPGGALADWRAGGYYARRLPGGRLLAVVLNTNALALGGGERQLEWLAERLSKARSKAQRVLLFGHIPPGPSHFEFDSICLPGHYYARAGGACWQPRAQKRLLALLREYADVVPSSFWGHHHTESIRLLPRDAPRSTQRQAAEAEALAEHVMFLSPSLTPRNPPHSPAVRLVHFESTRAHLQSQVSRAMQGLASLCSVELSWRVAGGGSWRPCRLAVLCPPRPRARTNSRRKEAPFHGPCEETCSLCGDL